MRNKVVIGNWKMHGHQRDNASLLEDVVAGTKAMSVDVVVCPPFPYLLQAATILNPSSSVECGAQDVAEFDFGAYTGEVSASMLADVGCRYALVGHSERRSLFCERDETIARKVAASLRHNVIPVLCVGETWEDREAGRTEIVVARQLDIVMAANGAAAFHDVIVAYEPVWAIGTGRTASPEQAQAVHAFVRSHVAARDAKLGAALRILYGGSVKAVNAAQLFAMPDIDGGLVGGASLTADEFIAICRAADKGCRLQDGA